MNTPEPQERDKPWSEYPVGTKAPACNGGQWTRVEAGWKWGRLNGGGGVFPTPGGDNNGTVLLPSPQSQGSGETQNVTSCPFCGNTPSHYDSYGPPETQTFDSSWAVCLTQGCPAFNNKVRMWRWVKRVAAPSIPARPVTAEAEGVSRKAGLCDTTMTQRVAVEHCTCATYPENLGPCQTFKLGSNERCSFCDHEKSCHPAKLDSVIQEQKLQVAMEHPGVAVYEEVYGKPKAPADHVEAAKQKTLTVRRYGGRIHISDSNGGDVFSFDPATLNHNNTTFAV